MIKAIGENSEPIFTENSPLEDDLEDNVSKMGDWQNRESTSFITVGVEVFQLPIYIPIEDISLEEKSMKMKDLNTVFLIKTERLQLNLFLS